MDLSEQEIENFKNMMNPQMLGMMKDIDPNLIKNSPQYQQQKQQNVQQQQQNKIQEPATSFQTQQAQNVESPLLDEQKNLIAQNPEMIEMMLGNLKKNPEMFKQMSKMMGNNPLSQYIENCTPQQLQRIIGLFQYLFIAYKWFLKVHTFYKTNRTVIIVLVIALLVYRFVL